MKSQFNIREVPVMSLKHFMVLSAAIGVASAAIGVPGVVGVANAQQLYKCVQDGKTVYQQEKCPTTARESTLRIPDAAPPTQDQVKAVEEKSDKQSAKDYEVIAEVTTGFNMCSEFDPGFRSRYSTAFDAWGGRNAAAYKAFSVRDRMNRTRERTAGDDLEAQAKREAVCARVKAVLQ